MSKIARDIILLLIVCQLLYTNGNLPSLSSYSNDLLMGNDSNWLKSEMELVFFPKKQFDISKGNFQDMLEALAVRETGLSSGNPNQYQFENPLSFIGKYQFGEILLIRLGYYKADVYYGHGADKNDWRGTWTKKNGIDSKLKFLNSPNVQEEAIREAFRVYWKDINDILTQQGKSINNYLGHKKTFNDKEKSKTITVTLSGILAGAYLRGPDQVVELLVKGKVSHDEFGTSILEYMEIFGGYDMRIEDL
ncbi:MAG: hypothetical protein KME46_07045 [Brasilonema angustatum HA4187-MV1]|nr:hypothetical protein [Brasilonema angustatum HA4187-MV1]